MIRKISLFLLAFCAVAMAAAAEYQVLALGDIHYDNAQYHPSNEGNKWQMSERSRYLKMWRGASPELLTSAAAMLNDSFPFVIQLGDFVQGDSDTGELQQQLVQEAFSKVKGFFPDHKLLAIKGNHDYRLLKSYDHAPYETAFMPLIAKELGRPSLDTFYTVRHGKDLFLFFDCTKDAKTAVAFVEKALQENQDARYVFFLTHYPVFPCYHNTPGGVIPGRDKIRKMLAARNAIILSAHTHIPSFISVDLPEGNLTQLTVSSMGDTWAPQTKPAVEDPDYASFRTKIPAKVLTKAHQKTVVEEMEQFQIREYTRYTKNSGFAILKIDDQGVTAEIHADKSGTPWLVKKLR